MSTRANIFIGENEKDLLRGCLYCHYDGYPSGVGLTLAGILNTIPKDKRNQMGKAELTRHIAEVGSYKLISPDGAPDASYAYTVDLEKRSVTYEDLWTHKKDWLCDF